MLALFEFIPTKEIMNWLFEKSGYKETDVEMKSIDGNISIDANFLQNGGQILIIGILVFLA